IDGYMLLNVKGVGKFDLSTANADGEKAGEEKVQLIWSSPKGISQLGLALSGELISGTTPIKAFQISATGKLSVVAGSKEFDLGIGGAMSAPKDEPFEYPRPVVSRCPNSGGLFLENGSFTLPIKVDRTFTIGDKDYVVNVDLGALDVAGDLSMAFNKNKASGIEKVGIVPIVPFIVTNEKTLASLGTTGFAESVLAAIRKFINENAAPVVPQDILDNAMLIAAKSWFDSGDICGNL
ncbi:MAG: hypothetical protein V1754_03100, partial [Pseudomonadota bacterium]